MHLFLATLLFLCGASISEAKPYKQEFKNGLLDSYIEMSHTPEARSSDPVVGHSYFIEMTLVTKKAVEWEKFLDRMVKGFKYMDNTVWNKMYAKKKMGVVTSTDPTDGRIPRFYASIIFEPASTEDIEAVERYVEYLRGLTVEGFKITPKKLQSIRLQKHLIIGDSNQRNGDGVIHISTLREFDQHLVKEAKAFASNGDVQWNAQQLLDTFRLNQWKDEVLKELSEAKSFAFISRLNGYIDSNEEMTLLERYWDRHYQMSCEKFNLGGYCFPKQ